MSLSEKVDDEARGGVLQALRTHGAFVLAATLLSGLAAFLAGLLAPATYRASIRIAGTPELAARWSEADIVSFESALPTETTTVSTGLVAEWVAFFDRASPRGPDGSPKPAFGIIPQADGSVIVWAESESADRTRERAQSLANRIVERETERSASHALPIAAEPKRAPTPDPSREALEESATAARARLEEAEAALADLEAERSGGGDRDVVQVAQAIANETRNEQAIRARIASTEDLLRRLDDPAFSGDASTSSDFASWETWRELGARRNAARDQVTRLSQTLLDGHPRMAMTRLRLSDIEREFETARDRLTAEIRERVESLRRSAQASVGRQSELHAAMEARQTLDAERSEAASRVDVERRLLAGIGDALAASAASPPTEPAVAPTATDTSDSRATPRLTTTLSEDRSQRNVWPIVLGSSAAGMLASMAYLSAGAVRRRRRPSATMDTVHANTPSADAVTTKRKGTTVRTGPDIIAVDEVIGAIVSSGISRAIAVSLRPEAERPLSVEIVRRLALRGHNVALVDLSEEQHSARSMGVPPKTPGVSDMISGDTTFANIVRRDFATRADVIAGGASEPDTRPGHIAERRNVIEFIERNYEVLLIAVGDRKPIEIQQLLTPDAALLVAVVENDDDAIAAGVANLREAGLDDMILIDDGSARVASSE